MARNRQRAKERQAARRAARQAAQQGSLPPGHDLEEEVDLRVGAPPEDLGRADELVESVEESELDDIDEAADRELELAAEEAGALESVEEVETGPRGVRGGDTTPAGEQRRGLGKVWHFFQNVWAELQRVQWPDRKQVTTLTGVVLGFVLIAGGYLGLLDAIFSRIIDEII